MSFDSVRSTFFQTIASEFSPKHPTVALRYENTKFEQSSKDAWIYITIAPGISKRAALGSKKEFFHLGVVNIQCMIPEDTGSKLLHDMTDTLARILADRNWSLPDGKLTTYNLKRRNRGNMNGAHVMNIMVEYRQDECL